MRRDSRLEWVRPPQQERSQRTLERLLDAAEAIMLEEGVEAANVAAVARRAKSSVGAFYARFPDKEALVRAVCERFLGQARATIDAALAPSRWKGQSLEVVFEAGLLLTLKATRERRPLLTGLLAHASRDQNLGAGLSQLGAHLVSSLEAFLAARDELPKRSAAIVLPVVCGVILDLATANAVKTPALPALSDLALARELTRLLLGYLALQI